MLRRPSRVRGSLMPALPADIAAGTRAAATAVWKSDEIAARYPGARDGSVRPVEGYFDRMVDAEAVLADVAALLGVERRRFAVTAQEIIWPDDAEVPTVRLVDAEQSVDGAHLVARMEIDLDAETTSLELFG